MLRNQSAQADCSASEVAARCCRVKSAELNSTSDAKCSFFTTGKSGTEFANFNNAFLIERMMFELRLDVLCIRSVCWRGAQRQIQC